MENPVPQRTAGFLLFSPSHLFQDRSLSNRWGTFASDEKLWIQANCNIWPWPTNTSVNIWTGYTSKVWRLDNSLLSDKKVAEKLRNETELYLSFKIPGELHYGRHWRLTYVGILFHIAVQLISSVERENRITDDIKTIDQQYAMNPSPDLHKRKVSLQTELNLIYSIETTKLWLKHNMNIMNMEKKLVEC